MSLWRQVKVVGQPQQPHLLELRHDGYYRYVAGIEGTRLNTWMGPLKFEGAFANHTTAMTRWGWIKAIDDDLILTEGL